MTKIKRKGKESILKCWMCRQYFNCSIIRSTGDRHCEVLKKNISEQSNACNDFQKGVYFYCRKRNGQVGISTCNYIRKTKRANCGGKTNSPESFAKLYEFCHNNCPQGKQIEAAIEHLDLIEGTISFIPYLPGIKTKLKKRIIIKRRNII
jgi:hypothetical protein